MAGAAPPLMSKLVGSSLLKLHAVCHGLAVTVLAVAIVTDSAWLAAIGAAVGLVGATAFAWFTASVTRLALMPGAA